MPGQDEVRGNSDRATRNFGSEFQVGQFWRWLLKTAGRWPLKLESAKECVTTHLPKQLVLKIDGAEASRQFTVVSGKCGGGPGFTQAQLRSPDE
ncbi:hypothetical protein M0804_015565 [Polistes exclamans]|nr:hypothetical protein M0804_015565 [Polistes exclamans]